MLPAWIALGVLVFLALAALGWALVRAAGRADAATDRARAEQKRLRQEARDLRPR